LKLMDYYTSESLIALVSRLLACAVWKFVVSDLSQFSLLVKDYTFSSSNRFENDHCPSSHRNSIWYA
jgi:hypothetical protein